ncbi:DNA-binding PadR family transcriptional regulator [Croceifilum oryzae]|uniref:DNA-binding PadR family transcriptional regulator n=1 Tax=Croceifilum oryzae TaxID=1553429 RepID=A0AAJ1TDT9_9BACL|nr:DUF4180 domain-containing protein [Croceifilum oryzae]MDQ0416669.1 DNA-binding PadR family transcriptional regulator [Croceifilum oryzae]
MTINHAILGMLSYKSLTGYELKKMIKESPFMPWSGNNNQIYKALMELLKDGFVTNEIHHQDSSPSKKIYTITNEGLAELKKWLLSPPKAPEIKKSFLVQLAWAAQQMVWAAHVGPKELESLLEAYEQELQELILLEQEKQKGYFSPNRNAIEKIVWDFIYKNIVKSYESELVWVREIREELKRMPEEEYSTRILPLSDNQTTEKEEFERNYQLIAENNKKFILLSPTGRSIPTEQDALNIVAICAANGTNLLLIHGDFLSDDFIKLRTDLAGNILQKFSNYNIKVATILSKHKVNNHFKELVTEYNKGNAFRVFDNAEEAKGWLLS